MEGRGPVYKDNQAKFDELYDKLVKLRDAMGKKLGYEGYTTLGYYRMGRNCYTKDDVESSARRSSSISSPWRTRCTASRPGAWASSIR